MTHIYVKAFPDSPKAVIEETAPGKLRVFIREAAENNQANKAVHRAVAAFYKLPENKLRMISGHQKQNKIFEIRL